MLSMETHKVGESMCYDLKLPEKAAYPNNKNMSHVLHQGTLMLFIFLAHGNEKLHCTKYY